MPRPTRACKHCSADSILACLSSFNKLSPRLSPQTAKARLAACLTWARSSVCHSASRSTFSKRLTHMACEGKLSALLKSILGSCRYLSNHAKPRLSAKSAKPQSASMIFFCHFAFSSAISGIGWVKKCSKIS